jgi:hypothetical protein
VAADDFPEPGFNPTLVLPRAPVDNRPIDFRDLSLGEQRSQTPQCPGMASEYQAAAGVAIEPMGECRGVQQPETQRVKPAFEVGPAAGPRMYGDSGRFVDD